MKSKWNKYHHIDIRIDYIDPIMCPRCGEKFVVTKDSPDMCILCKNGKKHITNFDWQKIDKMVDM